MIRGFGWMIQGFGWMRFAQFMGIAHFLPQISHFFFRFSHFFLLRIALLFGFFRLGLANASHSLAFLLELRHFLDGIIIRGDAFRRIQALQQRRKILPRR